jgi:hypothetical protein
LEGVVDKDLMVLTTLNLTLAPSILIFDFGSNILENPATVMRSKAIKTIKKVFDEQNITIPFQLGHWTLELKAGKNSPKWN